MLERIYRFQDLPGSVIPVMLFATVAVFGTIFDIRPLGLIFAVLGLVAVFAVLVRGDDRSILRLTPTNLTLGGRDRARWSLPWDGFVAIRREGGDDPRAEALVFEGPGERHLLSRYYRLGGVTLGEWANWDALLADLRAREYAL